MLPLNLLDVFPEGLLVFDGVVGGMGKLGADLLEEFGAELGGGFEPGAREVGVL